MKITKTISLLLLVMISAFSCDEADELTEFDITEDFTTTLSIDEPEGSESFTGSLTINIAENDQVQSNLDLLENVTLNSLTYEINNVSEASSEVIVTEASVTFGSITIAVADINLQESDDNNTVYEIADTTLLNSIATTLQNSSVVTGTVTGTVSSSPVVFDIIVNLDVTLTFDVL